MSWRPPSRVVVVGSDAPPWLTACAIHAAFGRAGVTVEVVALPDRAGEEAVVRCRPAVEALHARLGIAEDTLLRATRGAFTLGHRFVSAGEAVPPFFVAYGSHGAPIDRQPFLPFWLKARRHGLNATFADFSPTAAAALHGRMMLPDEETAAFGRTDYGYHLPAIRYARSLAALAEQDGFTVHAADRIGVERNARGDIAAVLLDGDRRVAGDLFVDASIDGVLIGALGVAQEERPVSPATRLIEARAPRLRSLPAYAQVVAAPWGWASLHPTTEATYIVAACRAEDEEAARAALPALTGLPIESGAARPSSPMRREAAWRANCVALGPAACRLDHAFGLDAHAAQLGLVLLLSRFPAGGECDVERADYNEAMDVLLDRLEDFQAANYQAARYPGAFWDTSRAMAPSPALAHRLALFAARGELGPMEQETIPPDEWQALLLGHGLTPRSHAPVADRTAPDTMRAEFRRMLDFIKDKVLAQPTHDAYLAQLTGAAR